MRRSLARRALRATLWPSRPGLQAPLAALLLTLAGCGGGDGGGPDPSLEPTIENIQRYIFDPACSTSGCHDALTNGGDLELPSAQASYDRMVNVRAVNPIARTNRWLLVKPGEPERSFLMRKLDGPGVGEGEAMPSDTQELHPFYRDLIYRWIAEGAHR